jgi:outer membrane protein OmpA-like peptidoglycan-associated protein
VVDRLDECPDVPAGPNGKRGCPTAYIKGDEIVILDQVHFATDRDIILPESTPVLEEVAKVLSDHPEIRELRIEGHTDVRASDAYNMNLSQRRVNSVQAYLVTSGVGAERITAKGYGHSQPVYDDAGCTGPDEGLTQTCRTMTSKNRRVVFRIVRRGAPPPRALSGADVGGSALPTKQGALPTSGQQQVLPTTQTLPTKAVLPSSVLPGAGGAGDSGGLPTTKKVLPTKSTLPKAGATKKPDAPLPAPSGTPPPKSP